MPTLNFLLEDGAKNYFFPCPTGSAGTPTYAWLRGKVRCSDSLQTLKPHHGHDQVVGEMDCLQVQKKIVDAAWISYPSVDAGAKNKMICVDDVR